MRQKKIIFCKWSICGDDNDDDDDDDDNDDDNDNDNDVNHNDDNNYNNDNGNDGNDNNDDDDVDREEIIKSMSKQVLFILSFDYSSTATVQHLLGWDAISKSANLITLNVEALNVQLCHEISVRLPNETAHCRC